MHYVEKVEETRGSLWISNLKISARPPAYEFFIFNFEVWIVRFEFKMFNFGFWILNFEVWIGRFEFKMFNFGFRILNFEL